MNGPSAVPQGSQPTPVRQVTHVPAADALVFIVMVVAFVLALAPAFQ